MSEREPANETTQGAHPEVSATETTQAARPEVGKDEVNKNGGPDALEGKSSEAGGGDVEKKGVPGATEETSSDRTEGSEKAELETVKMTAADVSTEEMGQKAEAEASTETPEVSQGEGASKVSQGEGAAAAESGATAAESGATAAESGATAAESGATAAESEATAAESEKPKKKISKSAEARKNYKGRRSNMRLAEKLAAERKQQLEQPWMKDGDMTYLTDAADPEYVSRWPYKSYKVTVHIALPHAKNERMFREQYPKYIAEELDMKPENFRMKTIMNPFHPEDWEEPEEDEDPLYIQLIIEGDIRTANLMEWNDKFKDAVCEMDESYIPGNILVFFFGLHTKPLPSGNRRREFDEDDDDIYW